LKTAIVIGISGQDGPLLSKLLLDMDYQVVAVTRNLINPVFDNLAFLGIEKDIEFVEQTDLDSKRIEAIIRKYQPDEVYNLAAQSSVGHSFVDPYGTVSYNILSVVPWLEAIKCYSTHTRFYQASSSEMFGNVPREDLPLKESLVFKPASPYGISKAAAHWLTINYREAHQLYCACGILFNHESCLRGLNYVVKKVVNGAVKLKLGLSAEPIKVGNVSIRRDWGYAPKYVEAMWKLIQHERPDDFLICSGTVTSLDELINLIMKSLDLDREQYIQIDSALYRPVDLEEIYGDNSKAKIELQWDYTMSTEQLVKQLITDEIKWIEWQQARSL